ncbi:A/G-specific DNA-adenine glycosylase [Draconibacterium orientale]|uniref:Adenine DNA glycosylase n=1 Tax=Draconibacterium orientale TaxID=1168034 RepID=X5E1C3_9BACT|nr:A/G-specific adenine glycosylase [Draconibacterium orientale]AHW60376.1 adenine glycosylase [Draconibacterium orientale]SET81382.1 A/G-specific DNA-adenine glycosylase [Draconibacterium orientale]
MDNFHTNIYNWYNINKRDLPWRKDRNPYKIWLSEIILQQTRVEQGKNYFYRFVENYPTVNDLANAHEDKVLKLWQGLGYYSRARNLHASAKIIASQYNGTFPNDYKSILALKGVGPYTAAAVASIAFNLPYPAVDGNIYRVLSRYYGIETPIDSSAGKKEFQQLAEELIQGQDPGMHNQALMEFGALQCVPKSPKCENCPVVESCFTYKNGLVAQLPVKEKKTKQRHRYFYYYMYDMGDSILLDKRSGNDIWQNLYQLPLIEREKALSDAELLHADLPVKTMQVNVKSISGQKKHVLSHQIIHAKLIYLEVQGNFNNQSPLIRVNKKDISKFAVSRLVEQFLQEAGLGQ